jgi:putative DNA primase/helicase
MAKALTPSRPLIPDARPEHLFSSPSGQRLVDRELRFWALYDLGDCVRQIKDKRKPGRADLLYKKAIRMGILIANGHIDQAEVTDALYEASVCNGLVDVNGKQDVLRNMERGFAYGATKAQEAASTQATLEEGQGNEGSEANESQSSSNEAEDSEASSDKADDSQSSSDDALIDALAKLSFVAYGRRRASAAEQLGIGVGLLDEAVKRRRAELDERGQEQPAFAHWTVEPSPEPVDGDALILALVRRIRSHVVMGLEAALTVTLWIMFAWLHEEAAIHSPILMVTSPEPDCGKTTLLGLVGFLVPRSLPSVGISPAALFRAIEKWRPTLIIDEADVVFAENEDLRAVVNSGWTRGQGVLRCEGDDHEPKLFPTFCPKAIGLKGRKLPDTTASRAIVIELKRKLAHETVADFRHIDDSELNALRQQLSRWAIDNADALKEASPTLPHGFANRLAANWHLLLAIAESSGGEWPEKAREAAATIAKLKATLDASLGVQLLSDIRAAFGGETDRLFSLTLVDKLTADPEGMWVGYNRGKPLTQKQLASRLRDYGVVSETIWIGDKSAKGYKRTAFEDVWKRYLQA